jgi:NTE family protein
MKKTALILSGGGAKGAFQCAAEKYAREVKGYQWDLIAGVSVGALNGAMLAMHKYDRLYEIWNTVSNDRIYTGGFNLLSGLRLLFGAKSFYGNDPLKQLLLEELEVDRIRTELMIGAVSLISGKYVQFKKDDPHLAEAILASTVMPIIWTPVDVSEQHTCMVDGGVRNITPIGDVLDFEPDEIVIINASPQLPGSLEDPTKDIAKIGLRTLDLMINELFVSAMNEFMMINQLVLQARNQGAVLQHPASGRQLKYYNCKVIEPLAPLPDTLDFSQRSVQISLRAGLEQARLVLG